MKTLYRLGALLLLVAMLVEVTMFDAARAQRAVKFFESLKHTKGKFYGKPFELFPWQKSIIQDVYGTVRADGARQYKYVYLEVPKKNGKSEIVAGSALYHTFADGERNGEVYGCAADKEQASLVFDVAVDMIDQLPALKKRAKLNLSTKMITDKVSGTFYKVVSSEAYSKHGLNISACIFDELHAQPNRDLWDVMTFGAGDARQQPIWWIITTAGDDPDRVSIAWEQHEYASRIIAGDIVDPTWYPVIYGYEPEENEQPDAIYDETLWQRVNPSLGFTISVESVREAAEKAKHKPADERLFRWLRLNQWVATKLSGWLPLDLFDKSVGTWGRDELLGLDCYVGMDLSSTTDLTALCYVFPPQAKQLEWRVFWDVFIPSESMKERIRKDKVPYDLWEKAGWLTVTPGDVVDYTKIEERILDVKKFHTIKEICADRAFATMLIQRLENVDLVCVDIPQTFMSLTNPLNETDRLLRASKITHENNPVARWAFGNASIAKNGNEQIKLVKEHKGRSVVRTRRIDPIAAWIDAMARATSYKGSVDMSAAILKDDWGM
jgi:phage terminase large subunit-like protein